MERGLLDNLTAEEQTKRIIQTEQAISNKRLEHESLEKKVSGLIAHGDYILNKVKQSHEFNRWLRPQDLENYLIGFFKEFYPRSNLSKTLNDTNIYNIYIDSQLKDDLREFCRTLRVGLTSIIPRLYNKCFYWKT